MLRRLKVLLMAATVSLAILIPMAPAQAVTTGSAPASVDS